MSGRYCEKHEEWAPTGECRWCESSPAKMVIDPIAQASSVPLLFSWTSWPTAAPPASGAELQRMMNDLWVKLACKDREP